MLIICSKMDSVSSIRKEFYDIDSKEAWPLLFQEIKKDCLKYDFSVIEAKKVKNKNLNRYRDVSPYDHTRIVLSKGNCDYINANIIKMESANRQYILTQGPLPNTTDHFWLMVWEQNCMAVIMLNKTIEKHQVKCHQYWPLGSKQGGEDEMLFTEAGLKVEFVSEDDHSYYITRVLRLTDLESRNSREILHFQYTAWPDHGVPHSPTAFLRFLAEVRNSGVLSPDVGPAVVHCSAGIGRSGTFCLVDSCLVMIKEKNECSCVQIREILLEMRRYRMGLVQTPEQLRFSYLAIMEGLNDNWDSINDNELAMNELNANNHEDGPPPLPPPRQESLSLLPPLPPVPNETTPSTTSSSSPESSRPSSPENNGPSQITSGGLHRRNVEKQERMAEKVAEMKRKQQAAESWAQFKRPRREDPGVIKDNEEENKEENRPRDHKKGPKGDDVENRKEDSDKERAQ